MTKHLLFAFLLLTLQGIAKAEQIPETEKLASTAKIWGFLKYYHPQVADGKFDWDNQLLEILPKVKAADSKEALSKIYLNWIAGLGEIPICKKCTKDTDQEYFDKNFDLSWLYDDKVFTPELCDKLKFIEQNRFQGKQHYVHAPYKQVGNVALKNEPEYKNLDWSNPDMRLLIAFKYWNYVEYFFPYKYQTDQPWDTVLLETIPKLETARSEQDFHDALLQMIVKINDAHGGIATSHNKYYYSNIKTQFIGEQLVVRGFYDDFLAQQSPIKRGDVILAVDDVTVESMIQNHMDYVWGSNPASKFRNLGYEIIRSTEPSTKKITFQRDGEVKQAEIALIPYSKLVSEETEAWKVLAGNIGYVNMGKLTGKNVEEMMDEFKDTKAIVFDCRNYPKGAIHKLSSYLFEERSFYKAIQPDLDYPGQFVWRKGHQYRASKNYEKYKGKVIVLVNEITQSRGEFNVMALQSADNTITVGSQSAGADGDVSTLNLGGGIKTSISGRGIFYPDGTETQRKGVKIDVEVRPTIQGLRDGRDEVLEKALELINN
ncbi:S41 family peptidase [Flagellimonas sediminis]|uniref:Peptidase S41 n=1 Tax=Flagellimonas sediminis TaxID=2696468 RepID=A0A6I5KX47_9FLAO|nr:S41 family peptidase [Allomuricauda sediminis]NDV42578.1 peptidase S41 [Allomuricauda sediminis]